jgi:cytochrome c oxidase subunit II
VREQAAEILFPQPARLSMALFAAAAAIQIGNLAPGIRPTRLVRSADAAEGPRVIEIRAKKFEFSPSEIALKRGEPVLLRLTSEDRKHGFLLKPFKIDTDITPGKATDIAVTPAAAGDYTVICDHYCGTGHGNMKMRLTVRAHEQKGTCLDLGTGWRRGMNSNCRYQFWNSQATALGDGFGTVGQRPFLKPTGHGSSKCS